MNYAKKLRNNCAAVCCALALAGCNSTVAPKLASSSQASFDQGGQNSGILGTAGNDGFWVSWHFVDRYNALIKQYGERFAPPLAPNEGIFVTSTNTAIACFSAVEHFETMNRWRKQGAPAWFKP